MEFWGIFLQFSSNYANTPVKQNITSNGTPKACPMAKKFLESTWQMAKKFSWHANLRYIWQPTIFNSSNLRAKWQYRVSRDSFKYLSFFQGLNLGFFSLNSIELSTKAAKKVDFWDKFLKICYLGGISRFA